MVNERLALLHSAFDPHDGSLAIRTPGAGPFLGDTRTEEGKAAIARYLTDFLGPEARGEPRFIEAPGHRFSDVAMKVVSIIGPSGCGKSTLLNMGSGLAPPTAGVVKVLGVPVQGPNTQVAFMLQKDLLLPWRTISQNVEFGLELRGVAQAQRREKSEQLLQQFRLNGFGNNYPHQLSGGMRQRAALARTLAVDPSVLLMDEPFSALDAQTKMILQQDLARSVHAQGKTVLFITHDLSEAVALSDRILVMSERPGTIVEQITVNLPDRDKPMQRRKHPQLGDHVAQLMALLKLDADTDIH
jgi:NitT/TauT family transport system ATP-binding protein